MAWWAFFSLLVGTFMFWFVLPLWFHFFALPTAWLSLIGESYSWFASAQTIVITAYMGFNSMSGAKFRKPHFMGGSRQNEYVDYDNDDRDNEEYYGSKPSS